MGYASPKAKTKSEWQFAKAYFRRLKESFTRPGFTEHALGLAVKNRLGEGIARPDHEPSLFKVGE